MDTITDFPAALRQARASAGLSQLRMAEAMEIPRRTIEQWEGGQRTPPPYVQRLVLRELERMSEK